jgi:hypothetical protein
MFYDMKFDQELPAGCPTPWDSADLEMEGWTRRSSIAPDRLREVTELYESLGFEVRLGELRPDPTNAACAECPTMTCGLLKVVYTRRRP